MNSLKDLTTWLLLLTVITVSNAIHAKIVSGSEVYHAEKTTKLSQKPRLGIFLGSEPCAWKKPILSDCKHREKPEVSPGCTSVQLLYGDDLIRQSQNNADEKYYLYDGLGSTRALTDSSGAKTDTYDYEAFGSILNQTGTTPNNYLFTGEQYDSSLNQQYLRARYYDPHTARFTQQDEWQGKQCTPITQNKYLYADDDPVNGIDPSGYFTLAGISAAMNTRSILSTSASGARTAGFSLAKQKGKKSITKAITCQVGVAYVKRSYSNDTVHGHHPINKSFGGANDQSKIYLPANTHRMFHFVLHHVLKGDPAFEGLGNWTSKKKWDDISSSRAGRRLLYQKIAFTSRLVDKFCGLKKPTSLHYYVRKNKKRFIGGD